MSPRERSLTRTAIVAALLVIATLAGYHALRGRAGFDFADEGVELAVRRALERPEGPLYAHDLERVTHLDAARSDIHTLRDLRLLPNVRVLDLSGNDPDTLEPTAALRRLSELVLHDLGPSARESLDLRPIAGLRSLERLDLSNNPDLARFPGLAQLTQLSELSMRRTGLSSLESIAPLTALTRLDLRETDLADADLSALRMLRVLEHLNLRETGVRKIDVLRELNTLRYLNLHSNSRIASLEPLGELVRLETLILRNVPLSDPEVLESLVNLTRLNARNTGLSDLQVIAGLMERGALLDDPERGIAADVDIRDNPIGDEDGAIAAYDAVRPYWSRISSRRPRELPEEPTRDLVINEVMTSNGSAYRTEHGEYPDWFEVRNRLDTDVDLGGYYLSRSPHDSYEWRFRSPAIVPAGGYLVVVAHRAEDDADGSATDGAVVQADFSLSSEGEQLRLTHRDGRTVVDEVDVPAIPRDSSYGVVENGDPEAGIDRATFIVPSPGRSNAEGIRSVSLRASHSSGFYRRPFDLTFSTGDDQAPLPEGAQVLYTVDGSIPDRETLGGRTYEVEMGEASEARSEFTLQTHRYRGPLRIGPPDPDQSENAVKTPSRLSAIPTTVPDADQWEWEPPQEAGPRATVVRAAVWADRRLSEIETYTYFVHPEADDRFSTPLVSVVAEPDELFGYEDGIYVPGRVYDEHADFDGYWMRHPANYSGPIEVGAHLEFFEPDGYSGFAVDGGIRIHGGWSRSHPLKSLRLYARKDYGRTNAFEYAVFPADHADVWAHPTRYRRLMLRSGQSLFRSTFQDAVLSDHLAGRLDVELMRARPVVHFINGEYWGLVNIRDRFDRFYLEQRYGVDPERVAVLEGALGLDAGLKSGRLEDAAAFRRLLDRVTTRDMSDPEEYRAIERRMDVASFIDYNVLRIYSGDPDGVTKHVTAWRTAESTSGSDPPWDGRWRWHTWDLDNSLLFVNEDTMSFYANDRTPEEPDDTSTGSQEIQMLREPRFTALIVGLLENEEFRRGFVNRFADLLNSSLHPDVLEPVIRDAAAAIAEEMPHHIARWGYPESLDYWRSQVEHHLAFVRQRPEVQRRQIADYFSERGTQLGRVEPITVIVPERGGTISVNSLDLDESTPGVVPGERWTGLYFSRVPVALRAEPAEGYRFSGWSGDEYADGRQASREIAVEPGDDAVLAPRFIAEDG
ncbi:MAG: CotH kinase family protein [Spirochaetota bacterium]